MTESPSVVLASASEIRSRILDNAGVRHLCDPAAVDEAAVKERLRKSGAGVEETAAALADAKAEAVAGRHPGTIVIGADQILECDGRWFDKPETTADAADTLRALRGRTHRLISAAAIRRDAETPWRHVSTARLTMRDFDDDFLARYLAQGGNDILASVGAYRLEGTGAQLFTRVGGDYFTVLGLPLLPLLDALRDLGALDG